MVRLLILLLLFGGLLWFLHWFRHTPAQQVAATLRRVALWGGLGLLVLATATGRLNPVFAALAGVLAALVRLTSVLQMLPLLRQWLQSVGLAGQLPGGAGTAAGQQSRLRTRYLDMTLDHGTGAMDGTVREGPFAGQRLSDLTLAQLLRMLELYQESDAQSAAVLTAYLDRHHSPPGGPDWRDAAAADGGANARHQARTMTREEAYAVLGLAPGADAEAVRAAHRRLMQKLHPDRGGSDWLAAQINAAKRLLLEE